MKLQDIDSVYVHDLEVIVNIMRESGQVSKSHQVFSFEDELIQFTERMIEYFMGDHYRMFRSLVGERTEWSMPTMPLNTDGIDPFGSNVTIRNVYI